MTKFKFYSFKSKHLFSRVVKRSTLKKFYATSSNRLKDSLHSNHNPFTDSLNFSYKLEKSNKSILIVFRLEDLSNLALLEKKLSLNLEKNILYTAIIKIRYNDNFLMAGKQFGFKYINIADIQDIKIIIDEKLNTLFDVYSLGYEEILYVQLTFNKVNSKIISEFSLPENSLVKPAQGIFNLVKSVNVPISVELSNLSETLNLIYDTKNNIVEIQLKTLINNNTITINFLDRIKDKNQLLRNGHIDKIEVFDNHWQFSLVYINNTRCVLGINKISDSIYQKIRYSLNGYVLNNTVDFLQENGVVIRKEGNSNLYIKNGVLLKKEQDVKLLPISKIVLDSQSTENPNIGVIDTETYRTNNDTYEIYTLGFKTNLSEEPVIYYVSNSVNENGIRCYNSSEIVLELVNELLRPKYNNIVFFCHNFGKFDVLFILKVLLDYNESNVNKYKISPVFRDNNIISLTISYLVSGVKRTLIIKDSYALLTNSLKKLGKDFNVHTLKGVFPYKFSLQDNLNYIGSTPGINYYNNITESEYKLFYSDIWDFKLESIKYLKEDLFSLHQVLSKANKQLFLDYGLDLHNSSTISKLALNLYLGKYYDNNIPNVNKASMYNDIKRAYYGAITEVYRPYGENLNYYDVNSLYPYVALQDMPGLICRKIQFYEACTNIANLFGFYYCRIETPKDSYLGLLPVRNSNGIEFPLGKWAGWYFSEELKFAKANGYKIEVIKGYSFNRVKDVFKNYIEDIYEIKRNTKNTTQKSIAKSLLNNLLGRFGIHLDKPVTDIVSKQTMDSISAMRVVKNYQLIADDKFLLTYINKLDNDVINSHNLDIIKLLSQYKDIEGQSFEGTSVIISAAVTAYGRIHMSKLKLDIIKREGKLFYSDTDSIVTDFLLGEELVDNKQLGKLKLEYQISKGIFISGKTYCFKDINNNFICKSKGVKASSLQYTDYVDLLANNDVSTAIKTQSNKNWAEGYVSIEDKQVTLSADSYKKRFKLYDNSNKWVNTKPNRINQLDLSLIIYKAEPLSVMLYDKLVINWTKYKNLQLKANLSHDFFTQRTSFKWWDFIIYDLEHLLALTFLGFSALASILTSIENDDYSHPDNDLDEHVDGYSQSKYDSDSTQSPQELVELHNLYAQSSEYEVESYSEAHNPEVIMELVKDKIETSEISTEEKVFNTIQNNWEGFALNRVLEIFPGSNASFINDNIISQEFMDKLSLVSKEIPDLDSKSTRTSISLSSTASVESSELFERLVKDMRSGHDVAIYSPQYPEFHPLNPSLIKAELETTSGDFPLPVLVETPGVNNTAIEGKGKEKELTVELEDKDKGESYLGKAKRRYLLVSCLKNRDFSSVKELIQSDDDTTPIKEAFPEIVELPFLNSAPDNVTKWETKAIWEIPLVEYKPLLTRDLEKEKGSYVQTECVVYSSSDKPASAIITDKTPNEVNTTDLESTSIQTTDRNTYHSVDTRHPSNGEWMDNNSDLGLEKLFEDKESLDKIPCNEKSSSNIVHTNKTPAISREVSIGSLIDCYLEDSPSPQSETVKSNKSPDEKSANDLPDSKLSDKELDFKDLSSSVSIQDIHHDTLFSHYQDKAIELGKINLSDNNKDNTSEAVRPLTEEEKAKEIVRQDQENIDKNNSVKSTQFKNDTSYYLNSAYSGKNPSTDDYPDSKE